MKGSAVRVRASASAFKPLALRLRGDERPSGSLLGHYFAVRGTRRSRVASTEVLRPLAATGGAMPLAGVQRQERRRALRVGARPFLEAAQQRLLDPPRSGIVGAERAVPAVGAAAQLQEAALGAEPCVGRGRVPGGQVAWPGCAALRGTALWPCGFATPKPGLSELSPTSASGAFGRSAGATPPPSPPLGGLGSTGTRIVHGCAPLDRYPPRRGSGSHCA